MAITIAGDGIARGAGHAPAAKSIKPPRSNPAGRAGRRPALAVLERDNFRSLLIDRRECARWPRSERERTSTQLPPRAAGGARGVTRFDRGTSMALGMQRRSK